MIRSVLCVLHFNVLKTLIHLKNTNIFGVGKLFVCFHKFLNGSFHKNPVYECFKTLSVTHTEHCVSKFVKINKGRSTKMALKTEEGFMQYH